MQKKSFQINSEAKSDGMNIKWLKCLNKIDFLILIIIAGKSQMISMHRANADEFWRIIQWNVSLFNILHFFRRSWTKMSYAENIEKSMEKNDDCIIPAGKLIMPDCLINDFNIILCFNIVWIFSIFIYPKDVCHLSRVISI